MLIELLIKTRTEDHHISNLHILHNEVLYNIIQYTLFQVQCETYLILRIETHEFLFST